MTRAEELKRLALLHRQAGELLRAEAERYDETARQIEMQICKEGKDDRVHPESKIPPRL